MVEKRKGMLIVISGPSGTGKGTLCSRIMRQDPSLAFSVSATTRQRRHTEIDGVHYHFVSEEKYDELLKEDAFLEHATVHGHRYGTLVKQVEMMIDKGKCVVLDIDTQGARSVMLKRPDCVSIFILPPSYASLKMRLHTRNTDDEVEIQRRLGNAKGEIDQLINYQYVVVNDDLELATYQLSTIIAAEKQRTTRYFPVVEE